MVEVYCGVTIGYNPRSFATMSGLSFYIALRIRRVIALGVLVGEAFEPISVLLYLTHNTYYLMSNTTRVVQQY